MFCIGQMWLCMVGVGNVECSCVLTCLCIVLGEVTMDGGGVTASDSWSYFDMGVCIDGELLEVV